MSPRKPHRHGHAVVIGASMSGLLAARALSSHFERVTIIERDTINDTADARRGVPQGRHAHILLVRGQQILSDLFPGILDAFLARGAVPICVGRDLRWHHFGCWKKQYPSTLTGFSISRPSLEAEIRKCVRELPNVSLVDGTAVSRYLSDWERAHITGVCIHSRRDDLAEDYIHADLVVDASGRGSQTPLRLAELGYSQPFEERVRINYAYSTRIYEQPAGSRDWKSLYVTGLPFSRRGGLILPIEGHRWMVTLVGCHNDHPPIDEPGFMQFARSLPVPDLYAAIRKAEPIGGITTHGFPASQRRHYESLARFPSGLIVLGDALCSFNPIFGQGMTVATLEAKLLNDCLEELASRRTPSLDALTCNFRNRVARIVDVPWQLALTEDLRFPQTNGKRGPKVRFMHWYTERLHRGAGESALLAERFHNVMHMLAPRSSLFSASVLAELVRMAFRNAAQNATSAREVSQQRECQSREHERIDRTTTTTPTVAR